MESASRSVSQPGSAFLSFSLGPVQTFIASARTLRDLWTGSYLLAWLTLHAIKVVYDREGARIVFPSLAENPLAEWLRSPGNPAEQQDVERLLSPSLPNRFLAEISEGIDAWDLAENCKAACRKEWLCICDHVRKALDGKIPSEFSADWDRLWSQQVDSYFEMRTAVLPWSECDALQLDALLGEKSPATADADALWRRRWKLLVRMAEAQRGVRPVTPYRVGGDVPQKCSLLGSYEQMGPAGLDASRQFWQVLAETLSKSRIGGSRLGTQDRFCAISLVKRFAWPAYFARTLQVNPKSKRLYDTATVAAIEWIQAQPEINIEEEWRSEAGWSGQWLHWREQDPPDKDDEDSPGDVLWQRIREKRTAQGGPPAYLAVLHMDGDRMGDILQLGTGDWQREVSGALGRFSLNDVQELVKNHLGELIYSGGDDVLAFLPTAQSLVCAQELNDQYRQTLAKVIGPDRHEFAQKGTMSAGLAIVHYKEDLRFALDAARHAEKAAKHAGRNCLQLTVCRRSGEHASAICPWDFVTVLQKMVDKFRHGATDRWSYHLTRDLSTLSALGSEAFRSQLRRQVKRSGSDSAELFSEDEVASDFDTYLTAMKARNAESKDADIIEWFLTLCQSASFLARGRDA